MCLAVPGKIIHIIEPVGVRRAGKVQFGAIIREANLAFVPEAQEGDYVLVHAGVAISTVNQDEADRIFDYLDQVGDLDGLGP